MPPVNVEEAVELDIFKRSAARPPEKVEVDFEPVTFKNPAITEVAVVLVAWKEWNNNGLYIVDVAAFTKLPTP